MLWESVGGWDDCRYQFSALDSRLLELELLNKAGGQGRPWGAGQEQTLNTTLNPKPLNPNPKPLNPNPKPLNP